MYLVLICIYIIIGFLSFLFVYKHLNRIYKNQNSLTEDDKIKYRAFIRNDLDKIDMRKMYLGAFFLVPIRLFLTFILISGKIIY